MQENGQAVNRWIGQEVMGLMREMVRGKYLHSRTERAFKISPLMPLLTSNVYKSTCFDHANSYTKRLSLRIGNAIELIGSRMTLASHS